MEKNETGWLVFSKRGAILHVSHRKDDLVVFPGETITRCKITYKTNAKSTTSTKHGTAKPKRKTKISR